MKIKELSYALFAFNYKLGSMLPIKKDFVFSIMTHDESPSGNIKTLTKYLSKVGKYSFYYVAKEERRAYFHLLFVLPFVMSRAEIILMDNAFMPMSFFKVRKETKVLQLWHGTGSIKKFGQDSNTGRLRELERRHNANIDCLFVNSAGLVREYAGAFGVPESKVYATGLPRTDWLLTLLSDKNRFKKTCDIREKIEKFMGEGSLKDKKIILYAPTFRDNETDNPKLHMNVSKLAETLPCDYLIFLKLHPFVSRAFKGSDLPARVINISDYQDLNELMVVSCGLITDYSSIIFDYVVLDKPMYFFADDILDFETNGRGFYLDYRNELPGILPSCETELGRKIVNDIEGSESNETRLKRRLFLDKYYDWLDGKSAKRVYEEAIKKK